MRKLATNSAKKSAIILAAVFGITGFIISSSSIAADGKTVFNKTCKMCHGAGLMGAPKIGDAAAWADRISKGIETLNANAVNGINAMPPKGGKSSLSDEEVHAAVAYIVESSQ